MLSTMTRDAATWKCVLCAFVHDIDYFCAHLEWWTNRSPPLFRALCKTTSSFFPASFCQRSPYDTMRCHTRIKTNGRAVDDARNSFLWSSFA